MFKLKHKLKPTNTTTYFISNPQCVCQHANPVITQLKLRIIRLKKKNYKYKKFITPLKLRYYVFQKSHFFFLMSAFYAPSRSFSNLFIDLCKINLY